VRVYISGPIKGMPDGNKEAFAQRAKELVEKGHEPVNPWDINGDHSGDCIGEPVEHDTVHRYGCFLRNDIRELMYCDAITLLPGWQRSTGATTELQVATAIGLVLIA
jgi:hypothetical protein